VKRKFIIEEFSQSARSAVTLHQCRMPSVSIHLN
jgi:hypothetical protein